MTPHQLFREAPVRIRSWPMLGRVLACSAVSIALAVVLMAWQAHRFCAEHHVERPQPQPVVWLPEDWPTTAQIRYRMEAGCEATERMRETRTGLYLPDEASR